MPRNHHLLLIGALIVVGLFEHRDYMFQGGPLVDEEFYEASFEALATSGSAYDAEGFMYPPTFAAAGLWLHKNLGVTSARLTVRWLNFGCLVGLFWCTVISFVGVRSTLPLPPWGLVLTALVLMNSPGARLGINVGNVSFLIGSLVLAGFWWADRRPVVAGLLLATSLLLKPLAATSLPLLLLPVQQSRADHEQRTHSRFLPRRWLVAAIAGLVSLSVLWFYRSQLPLMFQTEMTTMAQTRSLSPYRISRLLGLGEQRLPIFSILTVVLCIGLWGRLRGRRALLVGALGAVPLTTLAVWSHTLVLFFPVAALALGRLLQRRYPNPRRWSQLRLPSEPRARSEVVAVFGAIALIYFVHSGGFPQLHPLVQIALLLPLTLAPTFLMVYWFATDAVSSPRTTTGSSSNST